MDMAHESVLPFLLYEKNKLRIHPCHTHAGENGTHECTAEIGNRQAQRETEMCTPTMLSDGSGVRADTHECRRQIQNPELVGAHHNLSVVLLQAPSGGF